MARSRASRPEDPFSDIEQGGTSPPGLVCVAPHPLCLVVVSWSLAVMAARQATARCSACRSTWTAELRGRDVAEPLAVTAAADDIGPCRADGVGAVHGSDRADLRTVADNRIGHIAGDHANDRDRDGCKSQEYRQ